MEKTTYNLGRTVLCDLCNKDWTDSNEPGGFIFMSKGVCPECAPRMMNSIRKYREEQYIRAVNDDPDVSFADFVREYRGGDGVIEITSL